MIFYHPTITRTSNNGRTEIKIKFHPVSSLEILHEINQLSYQEMDSGELSTDIVRSISDSCLELKIFLHKSHAREKLLSGWT